MIGRPVSGHDDAITKPEVPWCVHSLLNQSNFRCYCKRDASGRKDGNVGPRQRSQHSQDRIQSGESQVSRAALAKKLTVAPRSPASRRRQAGRVAGLLALGWEILPASRNSLIGLEAFCSLCLRVPHLIQTALHPLVTSASSQTASFARRRPD